MHADMDGDDVDIKLEGTIANLIDDLDTSLYMIDVIIE